MTARAARTRMPSQLPGARFGGPRTREGGGGRWFVVAGIYEPRSPATGNDGAARRAVGARASLNASLTDR